MERVKMSRNERKKDDVASLAVETGKMRRRKFVAGAATAAAVNSAVPLEPLIGGKESAAEASVGDYHAGPRAAASFQYRTDTAKAERINIGVLPDNGDNARFSDHSALFTKALVHDDLGIVNE